MSSEISLHRRATVPGEAQGPVIHANQSQNGRTDVELTGRDAEDPEEEAPPPEVAPLQPRAFASDMSQVMDVGVCLQPGYLTASPRAIVSQETIQLKL